MKGANPGAATGFGRKLLRKTDGFAGMYRAEAGRRAVLVERGIEESAPPGPNAEMSDEGRVNISGGLCRGVRMRGGGSVTDRPGCYMADGSTRGGTGSGRQANRGNSFWPGGSTGPRAPLRGNFFGIRVSTA